MGYMDTALSFDWAKFGRAFGLALMTFAAANLIIFSVVEWDRRNTLRWIERALAILEDALVRCRDEDIRTPQIYAALKFLEQHAARKWPFEQFREALENDGSEGWQAEGRYQTLNASLNGIKLAMKDVLK